MRRRASTREAFTGTLAEVLLKLVTTFGKRAMSIQVRVEVVPAKKPPTAKDRAEDQQENRYPYREGFQGYIALLRKHQKPELLPKEVRFDAPPEGDLETYVLQLERTTLAYQAIYGQFARIVQQYQHSPEVCLRYMRDTHPYIPLLTTVEFLKQHVKPYAEMV